MSFDGVKQFWANENNPLISAVYFIWAISRKISESFPVCEALHLAAPIFFSDVFLGVE